MKKLFILPAFVLFMTGASSTNIDHKAPLSVAQVTTPALNTKIDSINLKAAELNELIKQL